MYTKLKIIVNLSGGVHERPGIYMYDGIYTDQLRGKHRFCENLKHVAK